MTKTYTSKDIEVLDDRDHVRLRLPVYAGSTNPTTYKVPVFSDTGLTITELTFVPAVYKCINEIIDNSIDELTQLKKKGGVIGIQQQGDQFTVYDNGRGIPIDIHPITKKHTPEVVLASLRSGRNFKQDKDSGVIGQNGMGSSITNFCASEMSVEILRDNKKYKQTFKNGAKEISKPKISEKASTKTGTSITFQLDPTLFKSTTLPKELMENRAREVAFNNPSISVEFNDSKIQYKNGLEDFVKKISKQYFKFSDANMEFFVIFDLHKGIDEEIFTWVNSSLLFDGGLCNTQFLNVFFDQTIATLASQAKKNKCEVTKNDIKRDLLVLATLKVKDPEYDAQSKTRLTGPNLRKEIGALVEEQWKGFTRKNKEWLDLVFERATARFHSKADEAATKEMLKKRSKKVPGLLDATGTVRINCTLIITEGDSAANEICAVRDPTTMGSYPLTGKINNVWGESAGQLVKMEKVVGLLQAIGLVPGRKVVRSELNFGKIVIATDADYDGADIFTLLINLFHQYWPEMLSPDYEPMVYRLLAPNVVASKGDKRIHFPTMAMFKKQQAKYQTGYEIEYFKGLGSMSNVDWEMLLQNPEDYLIPITDDGNMKQTLELLFGESADGRKKWLTTEE